MFCSERENLADSLLFDKVGDKVARAFERAEDAEASFERSRKELKDARKVLGEVSKHVQDIYLGHLRYERHIKENAEQERIQELKSKPNITVSNDDGSVSKVSAFNGETVAQFWYPTTGEEDGK